MAGGGGLGGGEQVAEDGLGEPVHLQPAVIDTGQRLPGQAAQGLPPGQRVGGAGRQVAGQIAATPVNRSSGIGSGARNAHRLASSAAAGSSLASRSAISWVAAASERG